MYCKSKLDLAVLARHDALMHYGLQLCTYTCIVEYIVYAITTAVRFYFVRLPPYFAAMSATRTFISAPVMYCPDVATLASCRSKVARSFSWCLFPHSYHLVNVSLFWNILVCLSVQGRRDAYLSTFNKSLNKNLFNNYYWCKYNEIFHYTLVVWEKEIFTLTCDIF